MSMAAQKITQSQNKLRAYAESQALDRVAIPLIPTVGIVRAYQEAFMARALDRIDWRQTAVAKGVK